MLYLILAVGIILNLINCCISWVNFKNIKFIIKRVSEIEEVSFEDAENLVEKLKQDKILVKKEELNVDIPKKGGFITPGSLDSRKDGKYHAWVPEEDPERIAMGLEESQF